jgi:hypothetical protein
MLARSLPDDCHGWLLAFLADCTGLQYSSTEVHSTDICKVALPLVKGVVGWNTDEPVNGK